MAQTPPEVYSVGEVTHYLKHLIESNENLVGVQVAGEVSNVTYHRSGHVYFSIKDPEAQLSCVMFKQYAMYASKMKEGDKVIVQGNMSLYAPRGNYQLMVHRLRKQGIGDLYQQFLALRDQLQREGLFEPSRKRSIPAFPQKIAIITSPTGAAIRDMLQTIQRRYGLGEVIVIPAVVQGANGGPSLVKALTAANQTGADVILLGRGGGSLEDLWNFNEEMVARAVAASEIPVVSGVGHETDTTIVDFVADLRASTPTAAAEAVTPDVHAIRAALDEADRQLAQHLQHFIQSRQQQLDDLSNQLEATMQQHLRQQYHTLDLLQTRLAGMDISHILRQGYTLTLKDGEKVLDPASLNPHDQIETIFAEGRVISEVRSKK